MTKEETIKVLQTIEDRAVDFPYMTACDWVAISAAKRHLQEEPVSEDLEEAAKRYATEGDEISGLYIIDVEADAFKAGAKWQKEHLMTKAVETTFNVSLPSGLYDKLWIKGCKEGDKLLVIKKDEL